MTKQMWLLLTGLVVMTTASGSVPAHGGAHESTLAAGLWHSLTGIDHLLAMLSVGAGAAVLGRRIGTGLLHAAGVSLARRLRCHEWAEPGDRRRRGRSAVGRLVNQTPSPVVGRRPGRGRKYHANA